MWKFIGIAAAIGFLIEISWMFLGFLMFNAPNGSVANLYYLGGGMVCPIFPVNSRFDLYGLLVNPLLYGAVAWTIARFIHYPRSPEREKSPADAD